MNAIPIANRPASYFYVEDADYEELVKYRWLLSNDGKTLYREDTSETLDTWFYDKYAKSRVRKVYDSVD